MSIRYQNPVHPNDFADPFVLQTAGGYYAYGTAPGSQGRLFPVLRSDDLVAWEPLGAALEPLVSPPGVAYWAPEVLALNGRYVMFYSASATTSDDSHRLRMAVAQKPEGPFRDSGKVLMPELGFSIDASPFHDPVSGNVYLFFAMDFEADDPRGTGVAVVRLDKDLMPAGAPVTVVRARADWQIYQRQRDYKGRIWEKWFCVEGPHALFHEGRYYCFYSAGAWFGDNYGVGFAWADRLEGPWHDEFAASGPSVLKGIPGKVIGPGHSSIVTGPDGKTPMFVYHAWDAAKTARRMCIDPLLWHGNRPAVDGPSTQVRSLD